MLKILRPCFIKDSGIFIPFVLEIGLGLVGALGASRLVFIVAIFLVVGGEEGFLIKKRKKMLKPQDLLINLQILMVLKDLNI